MQIKPKDLLPDEWGALFIHYLVREAGIKDRHREISAEELTRHAKRFANRMQIRTGVLSVSDTELLDACMNNGWLVPSATSTWTIRDDLVRG